MVNMCVWAFSLIPESVFWNCRTCLNFITLKMMRTRPRQKKLRYKTWIKKSKLTQKFSYFFISINTKGIWVILVLGLFFFSRAPSWPRKWTTWSQAGLWAPRWTTSTTWRSTEETGGTNTADSVGAQRQNTKAVCTTLSNVPRHLLFVS